MCKWNKVERFLHNSSFGPQHPISAKSSVCHLPLHNPSSPCGSWIPAVALHSSTLTSPSPSPSPNRLSSFPFLLELQENPQPLLLRGLQHEFEQIRHVWSCLASQVISLNLHLPFQACKRRASVCRKGIQKEEWLTFFHGSYMDMQKRKHRKRGQRRKTESCLRLGNKR